MLRQSDGLLQLGREQVAAGEKTLKGIADQRELLVQSREAMHFPTSDC